MNMLKRASLFSFAVLLVMLTLGATAHAETYSISIHNGTERVVSLESRSSECMRGSLPSGEIRPGQTWHGTLQTETKQNHCWVATNESNVVLWFRSEHRGTMVKLIKRALLSWYATTETRAGMRARVDGTMSSAHIKLTDY